MIFRFTIPFFLSASFRFVTTYLIYCKLIKDFNWISKNFKTNIMDKNKNKLNILQNKKYKLGTDKI